MSSIIFSIVSFFVSIVYFTPDRVAFVPGSSDVVLPPIRSSNSTRRYGDFMPNIGAVELLVLLVVFLLVVGVITAAVAIGVRLRRRR